MIVKSVSFLCIYSKYREAKPEVVNSSTGREADDERKIKGVSYARVSLESFPF